MTVETSKSLDKIETGFTVFETDQVLTPEQLNSVANYLDDQERLTRVALLGVGTPCGLWPSLQSGNVRLSRGVGTTTDGDLLFMPAATVYDRYKPYDSSAPKYPPFYPGSGANMISAYELVPVGESDSRALPLSGFAAAEGRALEAMAAVLYVESYLHDRDLCTATECDNRGKDWIHANKLLLVDIGSAAALVGPLDTPDGAARSMAPVAIARPALQGALATEANLATVYRNACGSILKALQPALGGFYSTCKWLLQDIAPADPAPQWLKTLATTLKLAPDRGIQYCYDFLKDVAETYNAFRDAFFIDTAVCCPSLDAFPKHLVLGSLDPAQRKAAGRTGFYPSPMVSKRFERRAHARFLFRKLDTLIGTFAIPAPGPIRITPSHFEDHRLEERAIPFYYTVNEQLPVNQVWSYRLTQCGMESQNYSYNADRWAAGSAAATPLQFQIGAFDFLRIEGHVGRPLVEVQRELDALIVSANLPIDVAYLTLGQAPGKPVPPWWNTHLYDLQYLMRSDLAAQLDDAGKFGTAFVGQVKVAADARLFDDIEDNKGVPVFGTADAKVKLMQGKARDARVKILNDSYDPKSNWQDDVASMAETAAEMNESLSPVTKKDFVTPLDAVISSQPAQWLTWVDTLIKGGEDEQAIRSQLPGFLAEHPGLEHYAGVRRGGTFVVVSDANNFVVADFMLPYASGGRRAAPPKPPKLVPLPRPRIVFEKPVRVVAIPDKFRLDKIKVDMGNSLKSDIDQKIKYFDAFKDTVSIFAGAKTTGGTGLPGRGLTDILVADPVLGFNVTDMNVKTQKVDELRKQLLDPRLEKTARTSIQDELLSAEKELASAIVTTTTYVAKAGIDVAPGSDGATAMVAASGALAKVGNIDALTSVEKGLGVVGKSTATTAHMKTVITQVLTGRGMM